MRGGLEAQMNTPHVMYDCRFDAVGWAACAGSSVARSHMRLRYVFAAGWSNLQRLELVVACSWLLAFYRRMHADDAEL